MQRLQKVGGTAVEPVPSLASQAARLASPPPSTCFGDRCRQGHSPTGLTGWRALRAWGSCEALTDQALCSHWWSSVKQVLLKKEPGLY